MKKYYFTIASILYFALLSCSNEETKTQTQVALRPTVPILDRTVSDIDGNIYKIVTIGNQTWTKSNLIVSRYRNGDPIPQVQDPSQWANLTTGAWCYYNNDPANGLIYGKLYNWYAVNDPRGIAPIDWHVPSDAEWTILTDFLGGINVAGGKMKAKGTIEEGTGLWISPNFEGANSSGFTGLPGGGRFGGSSTLFNFISLEAEWISSTGIDGYVRIRALNYYYGSIFRASVMKSNGFSVRCLKN